MSVTHVAGIFFDHEDESGSGHVHTHKHWMCGFARNKQSDKKDKDFFSLTTNKNNFNTLIKQWHKLVISG